MIEFDTDSEGSGKSWHLDRRVPIALILAILLQSGCALWWASSINTRVDALERDVTRNEKLIEKVEGDSRKSISDFRLYLDGRFDRLEAKIEGKADKPR